MDVLDNGVSSACGRKEDERVDAFLELDPQCREIQRIEVQAVAVGDYRVLMIQQVYRFVEDMTRTRWYDSNRPRFLRTDGRDAAMRTRGQALTCLVAKVAHFTA